MSATGAPSSATSATAISSLPNEIWHMVLDVTYRESLRNFSLCSRACNALARTHIFSSLRIYNKAGEAAALDVPLSTKALSSVRHIEVRDSPGRMLLPPPEFFAKFEHLRFLHIVACGTIQAHLPAEMIYQSPLPAESLTNLRELVLESVGLLLSDWLDIATLPSLVELRMYSCSQPRNIEDDDGDEVHGNEQTGLQLLSMAPASPVKEISLWNCRFPRLMVVLPLLANVQEFCFSICAPVEAAVYPALPALHRLEVGVTVSSELADSPSLTELLNPSLGRVILNIDYVDDTAWADSITQRLRRAATFPALDIHSRSGLTRYLQESLQRLRRSLPLLEISLYCYYPEELFDDSDEEADDVKKPPLSASEIEELQALGIKAEIVEK